MAGRGKESGLDSYKNSPRPQIEFGGGSEEPPRNTRQDFSGDEDFSDPVFWEAHLYLKDVSGGIIQEEVYSEKQSDEDKERFERRFGKYSGTVWELKNVLTDPRITNIVSHNPHYTRDITHLLISKIAAARVLQSRPYQEQYSRGVMANARATVFRDLGVHYKDLDTLNPDFIIKSLLRRDLNIYPTPKEESA